ncbi:DUF2508 family protein [Cohnella boryungensis]|uniref:DUF2508 family protein n=1 Tax=Cohnella boryungensis TaxID=768479 RepID=A0ABV8SH10_9BACL
MIRAKKSISDQTAEDGSERNRLKLEIRRAEQEWRLAEWRFHHAVERDHVDYSIYCLEAAEKRLDMLLKQAKLQWGGSTATSRGGGT